MTNTEVLALQRTINQACRNPTRRALFSKTFYEKMTPTTEFLERSFSFENKAGKVSVDADICVGPDWLSVANINEQLPEMPNNLSDHVPNLHCSEEMGEENGERVFSFGGYLTATLANNPNKVIGCLGFHMNLYHIKAKELRVYIGLDGIAVAPKFRRMYIASTMGIYFGDYISERISAASKLLNYKEGHVVMMADFHHQGGEACFSQMANEIELCGEFMFPSLEVSSDAGW